jgi:hypothetical protein
MGSRVHAQSCRNNGDNLEGMICLESLGYYSNEPGSQELPALYGMPKETIEFTRSRGIDPTVGNYIAIVGDEQSQLNSLPALMPRSQETLCPLSRLSCPKCASPTTSATGTKASPP